MKIKWIIKLRMYFIGTSCVRWSLGQKNEGEKSKKQKKRICWIWLMVIISEYVIPTEAMNKDLKKRFPSCNENGQYFWDVLISDGN